MYVQVSTLAAIGGVCVGISGALLAPIIFGNADNVEATEIFGVSLLALTGVTLICRARFDKWFNRW